MTNALFPVNYPVNVSLDGATTGHMTHHHRAWIT
jgi:hypothetical protein